MHFLNKVWDVQLNLTMGFSFKGFGLGFSVHKYGFNIDLGFFWIIVEW